MKDKGFAIDFLNPPALDLSQKGAVRSLHYEDIYFQNQQGMEESEYVFLQGNQLPENWRESSLFRIGETGFGTGLNFLTSWKAWEQCSSPKGWLEFISCELHPLHPQQLQETLSGFVELKEYAQQLLDKYPTTPLSGIHRLNFPQSRISLILLFGHAQLCFDQLQAKVDAWYLDGFNPANNPDMWSASLFQTIARHSHSKTTLATFTVARPIREGLKSAGFEISKRKGYGKKREMLVAQFNAEPPVLSEKQPWAPTVKASDNSKIAVIGAGIAGLTLADKLSRRGQKITLIDKHKHPCSEASGNPQAMVMPMLTLNDSYECRFYLRAFLNSLQYYHPQDMHSDGVLQLALKEQDKIWQDKLFKRFCWPSSLLKNTDQGLLYASAGWLDTDSHRHRVVRRLHDYMRAEVKSLQRNEQQWRLEFADGGSEDFATVVLACGIHSFNLFPDYQLPLSARHGQISVFEECEITAQKEVLLYDGYITPPWKGRQCLGATFDHIPKEQWYKAAQTSSDHWQRQLQFWQNTPLSESLQKIKPIKARAGLRVTSPDHMPVCGPLINQSHFQKEYADLCHGKHWKQYPQPETYNNLYLFTGLGSRGYTSAPLLAEYLSNQILGETPVLEATLQLSVHPNRFLYRQLKKG